MKSKIAVLMLVGIFLAGVSKVSISDSGTSFRDQLCELVQLRDAGHITHAEYRSLKRQILSVMLH